MRDLSDDNTLQQKYGKANSFRVNSGLLATTVILSLIYLFSINTMATSGFQIKKLSVELNELEAQHKKLELMNSTLQSVSTIQQKTAQLNFVPTTTITYIKDDNVALK